MGPWGLDTQIQDAKYKIQNTCRGEERQGGALALHSGLSPEMGRLGGQTLGRVILININVRTRPFTCSHFVPHDMPFPKLFLFSL